MKRWQSLSRLILLGCLTAGVTPALALVDEQGDRVEPQAASDSTASDSIVLSGTVFQGDKPHPAELTFTSTRKKSVTVTTDEVGVYELMIVDPIRSVSIALAGVEGEPFVEFFPAPIAETTERDFHVPASRFTVRVVDAATGEGIGGAAVVVRNRFWNPGDDTTAEPTMSVMQRVECDAEGVGRLPPARPGQLALTASADGYSQMREPLVVEVADLTDEGIEIALEPLE